MQLEGGVSALPPYLQGPRGSVVITVPPLYVSNPLVTAPKAAGAWGGQAVISVGGEVRWGCNWECPHAFPDGRGRVLIREAVQLRWLPPLEPTDAGACVGKEAARVALPLSFHSICGSPGPLSKYSRLQDSALPYLQSVSHR